MAGASLRGGPPAGSSTRADSSRAPVFGSSASLNDFSPLLSSSQCGKRKGVAGAVMTLSSDAGAKETSWQSLFTPSLEAWMHFHAPSICNDEGLKL